MIEQKTIRITDISVNMGQIEGVKANPRLIKDEKYKKLIKSIEDNPEMLALRELLVFEHDGRYVCIGGNMRLQACQELGYEELPCKVIPPTTTAEQLNAYIIKDNIGYGQWDWDLLAIEWDAAQLTSWGVDLPIMETDVNIDEFFENLDDASRKDKEDKITIIVPSELSEEKSNIKQLISNAISSQYSQCKIQ